MYILRIPHLLRKILPDALWEMPNEEHNPKVYLTFDDGPHPKATPFVLEQLEKYNAKATFFCVGKNVIEYPAIYEQIMEQGHAVGNHTHNHLKGSATKVNVYIEDVQQAANFISSSLFRPPYGRIKSIQAKTLKKLNFKLVMWSLLSGDFDQTISQQRCLENVVFNLKPGDILVFHDSQKAWQNLSFTLPRVLEHCKKNKWTMERL